MEWDMKLPAAWDLAELGGELSIDSAAKGSSLDYHLRAHDCSVDLKLGGLGDFVPSGTMVPSSSTAKRARASSNGGNVVSCLVDGCISDLSKCREYHRRHKVCEDHSKTPVVVVGGREQRFCQQCSRFHLLVEFDEVKRSCRKRLEGHNRRRRKPQHDFMSTRSLIANHSGVGFSVYPQIFPTDASVANWSRIVKSEEDMLYSNSLPLHLFDRQHSLTISPCSYKEGKHFTFLQDGDAAIRRRTMVGTHPLQLQPKTIGSSESSDCKLFPNEITRVFSSDCAPSLLSSSSQTSGINLRQVVSGDRISMGQPLVSGLQYSGLSQYSCPQASDTVSPFSCSEIKDGQMGTTYVPDASDTDLHCGCVFQIGGEASSDGTPPGLPFPWQQRGAVRPRGLPAAVIFDQRRRTMEKYFGNPYRGDPGVPHANPERFVDIWIGSIVFSALTWVNPYMWQLSNQFNWHDKAVMFEHYHWKKAREKNQPYQFKWNTHMSKEARDSYYYNWPVYFP